MSSNEGPPAGFELGKNNPNFLAANSATPYKAGTGTFIWTGSQIRLNVGTDIAPNWKTITWS